MKTLITFFSLLLLLSSCNVGPKPINYGEDHCHFCSMTIVDRQHAAQLVTRKGKVYNFDAAECMIHSLPDFDATEVGHFLVTDYETPELLFDATTATFIISPNITSPMRANLAALTSRETGREVQLKKEGELFTWEEVVQELTTE